VFEQNRTINIRIGQFQKVLVMGEELEEPARA
jgi:hypothetical protein